VIQGMIGVRHLLGWIDILANRTSPCTTPLAIAVSTNMISAWGGSFRRQSGPSDATLLFPTILIV
jgi:hypothetical protein